MKKFLVAFILVSLIIFINNKTMALVNTESNSKDIINTQKDTLQITDFLKKSEEYTKDSMPGIDLNKTLTGAITGTIDNVKIIHVFLNVFGKEIVSTLTTITSIIVIIVIHAILKSITESFENKGVTQIVYYVQYILIVTVIMANFADIINMIRASIENLVMFINSLIPILITLLITTGSITTAGVIEPIILFLVTFIGNFIVNVIIPLALLATTLGIVSQISDKVQIDRLAKFFKSSAIWILGVVLTLFVGVSSLESCITGQVDAVTTKTTKAAVSSFIPVVGKILGDAVDTVMGCGILLKNAIGVVGIIIIIGICVTPIVKLLTLMTMYYLCSAICEPIADVKIVKLLAHIGDTYKLFLAILCSVAVILIIGITIVIKVSGASSITTM